MLTDRKLMRLDGYRIAGLLILGLIIFTACADGSKTTASGNQATPVASPGSALVRSATEELKQDPTSATLPPECQATVIRISVDVAALETTQDQAEANTKLREALPEIQGSTPKELDGAFDDLENTILNADSKLSTSSPEFTDKSQPIVSWMQTKCAPK